VTRNLALACLIGATVASVASRAHADDNPKRKVVVLEYRSGSSALVGIGGKLATEVGKQTSLVVLGPAQAKTVFGEQLEQTVVKCGGEAECVAKIGAKLGAADVLLIGVSELGDVILTMQRIDVASHTVSARIADSLGSDAAPSAEQITQYLGRLLPPTDFLRFGMIEISANETGALVTVGGERRGVTPIAPLKLHAPATYGIKVEKTGFVPFTTTIQLPPDADLKVDAQLSRKTGKAWYQRWWVVGGLGLVFAGAAGTTIYFATRSDSALTFMGSVE
jgi:hypothetical protein